jgi:hypothetical protein
MNQTGSRLQRRWTGSSGSSLPSARSESVGEPQNPIPQTLNPIPKSLNSILETLKPAPCARNISKQPETLDQNPKPELNPSDLENPKPQMTMLSNLNPK